MLEGAAAARALPGGVPHGVPHPCHRRHSRRPQGQGQHKSSRRRFLHARSQALYCGPLLIFLLLGIPNQLGADAWLGRTYSRVTLNKESRQAVAAALTELRAALAVPKVALLFLTPGHLAHGGLWRDWLEQAVGLVPASYLQATMAAASDGEAQARLNSLVGVYERAVRYRDDVHLLDRQFLFSFYTHTHPDYPGYEEGSVLAGTVIPGCIEAQRSHHSLIEAERLLLKEALYDELNRRFILVSETHVPLYPGAVMWTQLQAEVVSRVDGCYFASQYYENLDRWHYHMSKKEVWRKTSQWFSLLRHHAEIVVEDEEMNAEFAEHCHPGWQPDQWGNSRWVSCSDNEHYIAVLLAHKKQGRNTACWPGGTTYVDWTHMTSEGRPMSFDAEELTPDFFNRARLSQCNFVSCEPSCATPTQVMLALLSAKHAFVDLQEGLAVAGAAAISPHKNVTYVPLDPKCSLLLRKVHATDAEHTRGVMQEFIKVPDLLVAAEHPHDDKLL